MRNNKYYRQLKEYPLPSFIKATKNLLVSWENKGVFEDSPYIRCTYGNIDYATLPRAYDLIKLHTDLSVRIVIFAIGGPLYFLDKGLSKLFNNLVSWPKHSCKNSTEFEKKIENLIVPKNYEFIFFDYVSLFPNVGSDIVIAALKNKCKILNML